VFYALSKFSVHFLYSLFLLFFIGIRESPSSIYSPLLLFFCVREPHSSVCLAHLSTPLKASENEPKEKALYRQVFFKDI